MLSVVYSKVGFTATRSSASYSDSDSLYDSSFFLPSSLLYLAIVYLPAKFLRQSHIEFNEALELRRS